MAAPAATARQTPAGIKLDNGHGIKVTFSRDPDISFWEKEVQPPATEVADGVETKTMFSLEWETFAEPALKKLTGGKATVAYDPAVFTQIEALIGINDQITVRWPDGSTLAFWGYLQKFEPSSVKTDEQPEAEVSFFPTNQDDSGAEQAPVMVSVSGT